jgi:predicted transcriptional regulator
MDKMIKIIPVLVVLICIFSAVAPDVAIIGGYTVEPVSPDMITEPPPGTTVPVNASEVPPTVLLMAFALSISPIIAFPLELLIFIKMFTYLGYRKISKGIVFDNAIRTHIYTSIRDNPGINFNSIVQETGIRPGTLQYHLLMLKLMDKISILTSTGHSRYFENSGQYTDREKVLLSFIRNDCDKWILTMLLTNPEISWKDLKDRLGKSGSMITWYMNRMRDAGIIDLKKTGKNVRYEIDPEMRQYLEKYLAPGNEVITALRSEKISDTS